MRVFTQIILVVVLLETVSNAVNLNGSLRVSHTTGNIQHKEGSESQPEPSEAQSIGISATEGPHSAQNKSTDGSTTYYSNSSTENSVLSSLFRLGLSDIEKGDQKQEISGIQSHGEEQETNESDMDLSLNNILENLNNLPVLPFVQMEDTLAFEEVDQSAKSPFLKYLDGIRKDAWTQFKTMAVGYIEFLEDQYDVQDIITERLPLDLFRKVLSFGDKVNFLHAIGKKVDPEFVDYMREQLQPFFLYFENFSNFTTGRIGYNPSKIISAVAKEFTWKTIHRFVDHVLKVTRNYITTEEIADYEKQLAKSIPIAAKALHVFLNGPPKATYIEGRNFGQPDQFFDYGSNFNENYGRLGFRNGYSGYNDNYNNAYRRDDINDAYLGASYKDAGYGTGGHVGYGGYGAYDDYGMSHYYKYLDPYLLLAGIGAAVFLSWIGYKILWAISSSKAAGRKRRDIDEILDFTDFADNPDDVFFIHKQLEDAEDKYEKKESTNTHFDDWEDIIQGVNSLWKESKMENGCLKCSFFNFANGNHFAGPWNAAKQIVLSGVMHLLGLENSGQLADEVTSKVLEGQPVICERRGNTCDLK